MAVDVSELQNAIVNMGGVGTDLAAQIMFEACLNNVPVDTGETRDSGTVVTTGAPPVFEATIAFPTPQAAFTQEGTSAHEILPVNGRALKFNVGGVTVFAARVDHPGSTKDKGWFDPDSINEGAWADALAVGLAAAAP